MLKYNIKFFVYLFIFGIFSSQTQSQFGKNKIQYQKFQWKYIQTQHFDVYFHDNNKSLAEFAGINAERSLESIQKLLRFRVTKRIPLILYNSHNQFQQTNVLDIFLPEGIGGVTELFKNRVVIPFDGDYSQFRHVIHHELVHAVLNDMFYGGTFQSAISRGNLIEIPIWMNEGLCEWLSTNGLDFNTDVYIRDLVLNENLPDLKQLDGYNAYRGGQIFWWYVAERYGKAKISELITKLKTTGNVENAFRSTFNMKLDDFSDEWKRFLKKFYYPDIDKFKEPDEFAIKLTNHKKENNFYNTSPAISPQGDKVAFIADRNGLFSLFLMDLNNKNKIEEIIKSFRQQDFEDLNVLTPGISWDPEGKKLVISAKFRGEDALYIINVENKSYERIPLGFHQISSVSWSPKGDKIAFSATSLDRRDLFFYDIKEKKVVRLTNDIFYDDYPVFDGLGEKIYFISERGDFVSLKDTLNIKLWDFDFGERDIYVYNVKEQTIQRLTFTPESNKTSLSISDESNYLFYVSNYNGIGNIYKLDLFSLESKPVTNSLSNITQISLSRSGNELVFSALNNGGFDLFMIKNPSSITLDSIPFTRHQNETLSQKIINNSDSVRYHIPHRETKNDTIAVSYGDYVVDFQRQAVIKPSSDLHLINFSNTTINFDTNFTEYEYKLKFTPDVILGNPSYNSFWGYQGTAQMLFSDILGDHQIYLEANLWLDLKNSNFLLQYSYLPNLVDYYFSVFHSSLLFQQVSNYDIYRLRNYGFGVNLSFPLTIFNRFEMNFDFFNATRENTTNPLEPSISRTLLYPDARFVYDDVLYGVFAPVRGTRYFIEFKAIPKIFSNSIGLFTLKFDYRRYWDFGYFLKLAFRGTGGKSFGANPQKFYLGGVNNWINYYINTSSLIFENPEDFAFMELITPLRGWEYARITGTQYFASNAELRFPLFTALLPGPIPIIFNDIFGVLFFDIGGAWSGDISAFKSTTKDKNGRIIPNNLLMSAGIGARAWIVGLPIKLDIAWRNEFHGWSKPVYLFSIDLDF
ncbi:MAG: peptidase MA family metallohydrolase [Candidatus Kapaibacteriales bacterium]